MTLKHNVNVEVKVEMGIKVKEGSALELIINSADSIYLCNKNNTFGQVMFGFIGKEFTKKTLLFFFDGISTVNVYDKAGRELYENLNVSREEAIKLCQDGVYPVPTWIIEQETADLIERENLFI